MDTDVIVVGGGLAGLTAAARLAESGAETTVLERRASVGGRVRSRTVDGFTLDHGFQVLFTGYPAVREEVAVGDLSLRSFSPGATICRNGARSVLADPLRDPARAFESLSNTEISLADKFRTLALRYDLSRRPEADFFSGADASIREYLDEWGFSKAYVERFVEPFYGSITLDRSLSTSKHVFEYTFRAMSRGKIAVPAAGMGAIPEQVAERARDADAEIRTETPVERVAHDDPDGAGARVVFEDGRSLRARAVVVAASPPEAKRLTGVESIPTDGVGTVTQWYTLPEGTPFGTGGRILLNADDGTPAVVVPLSEVAPEYAPNGQALLAASFVGAGTRDRDADDLLARTRNRLASWYPARDFGGLRLVATDRIPFAQFAQPPGFHESLPAVDEPESPVFLAGDYTEWSSIQGALKSGRTASDRVRTLLDANR